LASPVEVFSRRRGVEAAVTMARKHWRSRTTPRSWTCSARRRPDCWPAWTKLPTGDTVLDTEPQLSRRVSGADLDLVLEAMARLID
jgi:hypothetical protein